MKKILITISLILFSTKLFAADTGSCGTNCIYTYDPKSETLTYSVADSNDPTPAVINKSDMRFELSGPATNVTISEGIQKIEWKDSWYCTFSRDDSTGKLILPHSLLKLENHSFGNLKFSQIEINSDQAVFESGAFRFNPNANSTLILSENSNASFNKDILYGSYQGQYFSPASLNIACKGNPNECLKKFQSLRGIDQNIITADYYKGYDKNGNLIEIWDKNGKKTYSYTYANNGDYAMYDGDGNFMGNFMADGSKRRIYTVDEATAVTGRKNTFSIRYR